jgi:hypothetical protein
MQTIQEKLDRGIKLLNEAGNDSDLLGAALLKLHGALEDHFRALLTTKYQVPTEVERVKWLELVKLMQEHEGLSAGDRDFILNMNKLRNTAAHGDLFTGTRTQLENYASYVKRTIGSTVGRSTAADRHSEPSTKSNYSELSNLPDFNFGIWAGIPIVKIRISTVQGRVIDSKERTYRSNQSTVTEQKIWLQLQNSQEEYLELLDFNLPVRKGQNLSVVYGTCNKITKFVAVGIHELDVHYCSENILAAFPITPIPLTSMLRSLQGKEISQVILSYLFFALGWSFAMFGFPELVRNIFNKKFKTYMFNIMNP